MYIHLDLSVLDPGFMEKLQGLGNSYMWLSEKTVFQFIARKKNLRKHKAKE